MSTAILGLAFWMSIKEGSSGAANGETAKNRTPAAAMNAARAGVRFNLFLRAFRGRAGAVALDLRLDKRHPVQAFQEFAGGLEACEARTLAFLSPNTVGLAVRRGRLVLAVGALRFLDGLHFLAVRL